MNEWPLQGKRSSIVFLSALKTELGQWGKGKGRPTEAPRGRIFYQLELSSHRMDCLILGSEFPIPWKMTVGWQVTANAPFELKLLWVYKKLYELTWIMSSCRKSYWWIKGQLSQALLASSRWLIRGKSGHCSHWCFLLKKDGGELSTCSLFTLASLDMVPKYCPCRKVTKYFSHFLMIIILLIIATIRPPLCLRCLVWCFA